MAKAWFRAKRFGYGAGLPMSWEGWVVCAGYALAVTAAVRLSLHYLAGPERIFAVLGSVLILTALLIAVVRPHTEGGWRWRNGEDA